MPREGRRGGGHWGGDFLGSKYLLEADYSGDLFEIPDEIAERMKRRLAVLYGADEAPAAFLELERVLRVHHAHGTPEILAAEEAFRPEERFSERDMVLITYGDLILSDERCPLETLSDFADEYFRGVISTMHILPFYPYSSDRGFSVISFEEVDPRLGDWDDIADLEDSFKLMFDGVFNHVSSKSYWFQQYLAGNPEYRDYFIGFSSRQAIDDDRLRLILRPRTTPLLHEFLTVDGPRWVWTTFSDDQVDLNFKNPTVLLKILEILLYYVRRGADLLRLDAITYLWCELGTDCVHLAQTHEVVKLFRDALDAVAPHVALVTETNVPHEDNITYFGDGRDEAQMVYNFALPPLVLHAVQNGDARVLSRWAASLDPPSDTTAFFNFLDSHDGIGLMGARGILSEKEIDRMSERVQEHGGYVSMKSNADGSESPYELNVTWFSALNRGGSGEPTSLQIDRFIASRAVALTLRGVPGIYLPSLIGHRNDTEAVFKEGSLRSINRSAIEEPSLRELLANPRGIPARIARAYGDLLEIRVAEPAFHPAAAQRVLDLDSRVFALLRIPGCDSGWVLSLINLSADEVAVELSSSEIERPASGLVDLVAGDTFGPLSEQFSVALAPYQVRWLKAAETAGDRRAVG